MSAEKLALNLYTILFFHIPAIVFVAFFTLYFAYKAPKNQTSRNFLSIMGALLIWLLAKVLKTLAPTLMLRWTFVVVQYIGVYALSFFLIRFAYFYTKNKRPPLLVTALTLGLSVLNFSLVLTNPIHMRFYRSFDLYYDKFGPLFMPTQIIQYAMILSAAVLLVAGYRQNSAPISKKFVGCCLSFFTIAPLVVNVYYILFKVVDIPWILPFAVFDVTPISISISLIFFIIPALKMRFLNLRTFANHHIYHHLSHGILSFSDDGRIHAYNDFCVRHFPDLANHKDLRVFLQTLEIEEKLIEYGHKTYSLHVDRSQKGMNHLWVHDVTCLIENQKSLEQKNQTLQLVRDHLKSHAKAKLDAELLKMKSSFAQDLHDIIGHSLTVFLASKKSLLDHTQTSDLKADLLALKGLLQTSTKAITETVVTPTNSLKTLFSTLEMPTLKVHFLSEGRPVPLPHQTVTVLHRVAQESVTNAIKHGHAQNIFFILHYHDAHVKCRIYDDGLGAKDISPNMGLHGIKSKIAALSGAVDFASDGKKGFHTDITLPI
ncbi:signal transduction histidine kinase [Fusibacter tunisiensis]|uniref:histidine kinase n=2 Tax=Fusibacter tunisiensis TaxID=1008308 RepID=A0ABS2MNF4_9FIRM|nr:histidine kinase N-terminal 7TM domain-containing protein [Fusibacter tunisiensis]MBM7560933.1 signal transduction histidine kinase [Fusibacter tunisiensis]